MEIDGTWRSARRSIYYTTCIGTAVTPFGFGLIAIVMVFLSLANVFVQSGFNTALIQKKDADDEDFSSVLYLSISIALLLYLLIFFTSPAIARFYNDDRLIIILRVLSVTLFLGAFNSIQNAYVAKNMMFRKLFYSSLGAVLVSGIAGITLAFAGFGVWALVTQQLISQLMICIILWFTVRWRPQVVFSVEKVKSLFNFGWKLLVSNLLHYLYIDIRTLLIGRLYSSSMLGFYNRGENFPKLIGKNIDGSIQSVMLPAFSKHQDNRRQLKSMVRRTVKTSSYLIFPAMVGLAVVAEPLVKIILTDKWLPSVPFIQIFCITYALLPIQRVNLQAINAMGRSDIILKLQVIKITSGFIVLFFTIPFGVYAIAAGTIISGILAAIINIYPNKKLLEYNYKEQFMDIIPALLGAVSMGVIVYMVNLISITAGQTLLIQIIIGITVYIALSKLFRINSYKYLMETLIDLKIKKRGSNEI